MTRIVVCAAHRGGEPAVRALIEHGGYEITAIVCLSPAQAERYSVSGYHNYRPMAVRHGVPVYEPASYSLKSAADQRFFESLGAVCRCLDGVRAMLQGQSHHEANIIFIIYDKNVCHYLLPF